MKPVKNRATAFVISFCVALTALPSFAAWANTGSAYLTENFILVPAGELPTGWSTNKRDSVQVVQKENSFSKELVMQAESGSNLWVGSFLDKPASGLVVFQTQLTPQRQIDSGVLLRDNNDNMLEMIRFSSTGDIFSGSQKLQSYESRRQYDVAFCLNTVYGTYDIYIDSEKATSGRYSQQGMGRSISGFKFYCSSLDTSGSLRIGDLYVYAGGALLDVNEFKTIGNGTHPLFDSHTNDAAQLLREKLAIAEEANHAMIDGIRIPLDNNNPLVRMEMKNGVPLIPLSFFAKYLQVPLIWQEELQTAVMNISDKEFVFKEGATVFSVNNRDIDLPQPIISMHERLFVPVVPLALATGKSPVHADGLVLISDSVWNVQPFSGTEVLKEARRMSTFARPSAAQMLQDITSHSQNQHPRLLINQGDVDEMKEKVATDPLAAEMYDFIKKQANLALNAKVGSFTNYNDYRNAVQNLSFIYLMEGDETYAARAYEELKLKAEAPTWFVDYLNLAVVSMGTAIGYDWLYHYLSPEQRKEIEAAILKNSLQYTLDICYRAKRISLSWWTRSDGNWNFVCNSGVGVSAMAVSDVYPAEAGEVLEIGIRSMETAFESFQKGGGWWEGMDYWEFSVNQLFPYLAALESSAGTSYGYIYNTPGLRETWTYPLYLTAPGGVFDYGDANSGTRTSPILYWMADKLQNPSIAGYNMKIARDKYYISYRLEDLLWYKPDMLKNEFNLPYGNVYKKIDLAMFRNSWRFNSGAYAAFLGSFLDSGHTNYDAGSFIYDAMGERWAKDLSKDSYGLPGYFRDPRKTYYRIRAEGHNTLVINPDESPGQENPRQSQLEVYQQNDNSGYTIADLTTTYEKYVNSARRGLYFDARTESITIQDELDMKSKQDVWWFMHTDAVIELSDDKHFATLIKGERRVNVSIHSPANAQFFIMDALPLSTSPNPPGQNINEGTRKLAIKLSLDKKATISVTLTPELAGNTAQSNATVIPLDSWKLDEIEYSVLSGIYADGILLPNFTPRERYYEIPSPKTGAPLQLITAEGEGDIKVETQKVPGGSTLTIIRCQSHPHGSAEGIYYIKQYGFQSFYGTPATAQKHNILKAENLTGLKGDTALLIDGDAKTSVGFSTYAEFTFDLGMSKPVDYVAASWARGDIRKVRFDIYTSQNGRDWVHVLEARSGQKSADLESYRVESTTARYVKLAVRHTETQSWNSLLEFAVYGGH